MTEETKPPFFINTKRLQRAQSYFDIGRTQERLRRLLEERRNSRNEVFTPEEVEDFGLVGYYGIKRFIQLDEEIDGECGEVWEGDDVEDFDEDIKYHSTSMFSLFWMTFKNVAASIREHLSLPRMSMSPRLMDPEGGHSNDPNQNLCGILIHPPNNDPRIQHDMVVYGDMQYLVQKFRIKLRGGGVDVALFSVELPETSMIKSNKITDFQSFVIGPECGSLVWIENGRASAIFMTKSSDEFFVSILDWFRKLLSDMTLADSVMIGHPYYWHPSIRRRLTRVMKYLKRLYRNLALKDSTRQQQTTSSNSDKVMEVVCPSDISKIVLNEQPSKNLMNSGTTHQTLNVMLEHLVKKWFDYQRTVPPGKDLKEIAKSYSKEHPPRQLQIEDDFWNKTDFLESVTFLDFSQQSCSTSAKEPSQGSQMPSRTPDINSNFPTAEGQHRSPLDPNENFEGGEVIFSHESLNEVQELSISSATSDSESLH